MPARSLLKSAPLGVAPQPSEGQAESENLRRLVLDLNRQITATIVAELAAGGISRELAAIIEQRDLLSLRLSCLEGTQHV